MRLLGILALVIVSVYIIYSLPLTLGLDLQGGSRIVLEGQETEKVKVSDDSMSGVEAVIRNRIDALGVTEPTIQRKGRNQVVVELPGVKDPDRALKLIGDTALLEFVEAEWAPGDTTVLSAEKVKQIYGEDARLEKMTEGRAGREGMERWIVLKKTVLTGADLKGAWPTVDSYGNPAVDIEFNSEGGKIFAEVTARNVSKPIAIILDNKIISAPNVREPIPSGKGIISGDFTADEMHDFVIKLKAGALPLPVKMIENRVVGPTLGRDSIDKSTFAGVIGFILVVVFMMSYYRLPGFLADLALCIYVVLVLAVLSLIHTTLTLPGIAGFLLSIGMAVDANVIIFERLKEELREGKSLRLGIEAGFERAFSAILDSNVTTIIAAITLFWVGTGTIKGFAVTLTVGILVSMFTAIIITRAMMNMLVDLKIVSKPDTPLIYK